MSLTTEARKPFYAVVGVGDLAVEKTRELPGDLVAKATTLVPRTTALAVTLPVKLTAAYGELVDRGQKLFGSIRGQKATQVAAAQVKTARSQAKGAATSAGKAAKATIKAVDDAVEKIG